MHPITDEDQSLFSGLRQHLKSRPIPTSRLQIFLSQHSPMIITLQTMLQCSFLPFPNWSLAIVSNEHEELYYARS